MVQFNLSVSRKDEKWINEYYPELKFSLDEERNLVLSGPLYFDMVFDENGIIPYVINPKEKHLKSGRQIKDFYNVRIVFRDGKNSDLPQVYEVGNRIFSSAKTWNRKNQDLHIAENGLCCLCIKFEEPKKFKNGFTLEEFFYNLVIPFFYAQSYFEQDGTWPWGDYSHDIYGALEWFFDKKDLSQEERNEFEKYLKEGGKIATIRGLIARRLQPGSYCFICKSKTRFKNCPHLKIVRALWKLKGI